MDCPNLFETESSVFVRLDLHPFPSMYSEMHYFRNLDTIMDDVHGLFDGWETHLEAYASLSLEVLHLAKLAVHEWVANIKQHADFQGRSPEVGLFVSPTNDRLRCIIEDNSEGFDLEGYLKDHPKITVVLPDRGMGLLMLRSCTEELRYEKLNGGKQKLEFYIPANNDPHVDIPFS